MMNRITLIVAATFVVSCTPEQGFSDLNQVDVFQQNRKNAVDLLVVVDNSCSMVEEQDNLATNFEILIDTFSRAEVNWHISVATTDVLSDNFRGLLQGGDDEIILRAADGGELDRVEYDRDWVFEAGVALQLDPEKYSLTSNDSLSNWCAAPSTYVDGSYGSPTERNPNCDGSDADEPDADSDDGPVTPTSGELLVTEIMAQSVGIDSKCEWFEITNTTDDTIILDGVTITDSGRNSVEIPTGKSVGPNLSFVVGRSSDTSENCDTPVALAFSEGLTLNHDVRVLTPDTVDAEELFSELVAQGTSGTFVEQGFEAARLVFEEPELSEDNVGFLREDAGLSMLFVSDEDDFSPYSVDDYIRYFTDIKGDEGYRDRSLVNISAVVGKDDPPGDSVVSCQSADGEAQFGQRYVAAANETLGAVESICEDDFAPLVERLGLTLSGLSLDFRLSEYPQLDTLEVSLYEGEEDETLVGQLVRDEDYTYVIEGNLLHFAEDQVPPSEYYIVASYRISPIAVSESDASDDTDES